VKHIIHPSKHKYIFAGTAAAAAYLGLWAAGSALAVYQTNRFWQISLAVFAFLIFLQVFIFDLHLKKSWSLKNLETRFEYLSVENHWLQFMNYLVLPSVLFWSTAALMFLAPFNETLKQTWMILGTLSLGVTFWYLKTVFLRHSEAPRLLRELLFIAKLFASYLAFAAALGLSKYFFSTSGTGAMFLDGTVFALSFVLMYQALFQHHDKPDVTLKFIIPIAMFLGACSYAVYFYWNVNFYSAALFLAALYNTAWGLMHHKYIDRDLTPKIIYEYLAVLFVVLVILFSTTNFTEKI